MIVSTLASIQDPLIHINDNITTSNMKAVTFLAYFAALEVATAVHTNETHVWFLSDLSIRHQAGLPSK